jgi:predicted nucleotidyltransferase
MKLDLSSKSELAWLAHLLADVESAVPDLNPLLVGAQARDLLLHYGHGIEIERGTADVDFAIAVNDWSRFSAARQALIGSELFAPDRTMVHRLQHLRFGRIDFIPFGAVEQPDGAIAWPPTGNELMDVLGYAEADAAALIVQLPER